MSITKRCELRLRQLQCVACWSIEMYSSGAVNQFRHFSPSTLLLARTCTCVHACIRTWSSCVCMCVCVCAFTSVRCMNVSCACVPCAYSLERACASTYHVRAQPSCVCVHERACAAVVCARSRACACSRRVCAFTSVRARRRLLCGPFPAAKLIKYILILISINMHILIYN